MRTSRLDPKRNARKLEKRSDPGGREVAPRISTGFALTSLVPILLAVYLLIGAEKLDFKELLGTQGIILLLMFASAAAGFWFIKTELMRTFVTLLERVSQEATGTVGHQIREASEDEMGKISETIQRITGDLEHRAADAQLSKNRLRNGITKVALAVHASRDQKGLLEFVVAGALESVQGSTAYLVQVDEKAGEFVATFASGEDAEDVRGRRIPLGEGVPGLTAREHRPLLLQDLEDDSPPAGLTRLPRSTISTPMFQGETLHGILIVHRREGVRFSEDDLAVLANLGTFTAAALGRREDNRKLEDETDRVLAGLMAAVEERDPYARGHAERVARYCEGMATALGLDAETIRMVRRAGLVHDLGKLALPDALLRKEGRYSSEELEHVRTHSVTGERLVRAAGTLASLAPLVRQHHERADGSGYPDGLPGDDIPLTSHILIVANAFDVMTSDRSYRQAMSLPDALVALQEESGSKFDARAVHALLGLDKKLLKATHDVSHGGGAVKGKGTSSISIRE